MPPQITQASGVDDPAEAALGIEWIELASMGEADIEAAINSFDGSFADGNYITDEQVCDWARVQDRHRSDL